MQDLCGSYKMKTEGGFMLNEAAERVRKMEMYFDILQKTLNENPQAFRDDDSVKSMLMELTQYYDGGQWLNDYRLDEMGLIPRDLKRGVLAEDSVYNLLDDIRQLEEFFQ